MKRPSFLTPRFVGASLGVLASMATCTVVLYQLLQAAEPAPTTLHLINESPAEAQLRTAELSGRALGAPAQALAAVAAGSAAVGWTSAAVALEPGRPIAVKVALASQAAAQCTLDARPPGVCTVRARYKGTPEMYCDYDCRTAAPR